MGYLDQVASNEGDFLGAPSMLPVRFDVHEVLIDGPLQGVHTKIAGHPLVGERHVDQACRVDIPDSILHKGVKKRTGRRLLAKKLLSAPRPWHLHPSLRLATLHDCEGQTGCSVVARGFLFLHQLSSLLLVVLCGRRQWVRKVAKFLRSIDDRSVVVPAQQFPRQTRLPL